MHRTVVYRSTNSSANLANVNDEIGLEPHLSYSIAAHLEDLAGEGVIVLRRSGSSFVFSNGTHCKLLECVELVDKSLLDAATLYLIDNQDSLADLGGLEPRQLLGA